ncbi:MAG TPA: hypothetical protein VHB77_00625 [Planctomycetaceae bacterium]|nr:hypothetical protein [Planctomycetaceae bacterium]
MAKLWRSILTASLALGLMAGVARAAEGLDKSGKPELKSAGPLAFGPDGVLFIGDPQGAAVVAIGVEAGTPANPRGDLKVEGIDGQLAGLLGTKAADILINDVAVQPGTGVAYLSVSRGRGPDAEPVIATVSPGGKVALLPLDKVAWSRVSFANAPAADAKDQRGNSLRQESITDLHFLNGRVFVAGLSNEEFASKLRSIAFPFSDSDSGAAVEIYHGAHGKFETRAPVRTFVPLNIGGEPHLLAAYTCTPLVSFPVSDLKAGAKLKGTTVAELGNRNRPLDIITYTKDGQRYLLLANSARGVMKISTDKIEQQEGIEKPISGTAGLGYDTIASLKGVEHLDKLGDDYALLLVRTDSGLNQDTIPLP